MIKFHTSINTVSKTWKKTEYSVFLSEKIFVGKMPVKQMWQV